MRERICPVKGAGSLSELQRTVRAQRIVDASGVNDAFFQNEVPNAFAAVTFRQRGDAFLREVAKRKRKPIASRTLDKWQRSAHNWLYPALGELPLSEVNNASVKPLISKMAVNLKPSTIGDHIALIKRVVASAVSTEGEQIYPRKWKHDFMDLPCVIERETNTPSITTEMMSGLARWRNKRARTLFIFCGASGLRVGEALGLDLAKHFSEDFRTLKIEQKAVSGRIELRLKTESSYREIDLDPRVAAILKTFAAGRTSGLLFGTRTGKPIGPEAIYRYHLHPALKELGFVNEIKGNHQAGMHIFRRFRETHLGKCEGLPRGIRLYWMGHAEESLTDHYDKIKEDRACRRQWAERCGLGFELSSLGLIVPISRVKTAEEDAA
jgi:integrase